MKRLYFLFVLLLSLNSFGQITNVNADPAVGSLSFTSLSSGGATIPASTLTTGAPVFLHAPIFNFDFFNPIPNQSIQIVIGLGSGVLVDPAYDLSTAPLTAYFQWSKITVGGQQQIIGTLVNDLPANFNGQAIFRVLPTVVGPSTMSSQVVISNDNANYNLSDPFPSNNFVSLSYIVSSGAGPLPVAFKDVKAVRDGCNINVVWSIGNEINVKSYEIETSKDGATFVKVGQQAAANKADYTGIFQLNDQIKAATIFVRVKVIDNDGSVHYSNIVTVAGTCAGAPAPWVISAYPNPVTDQAYITLNAKQGVLDGKYALVVLDNTGKTYLVKDIELSNAKTYQLNFGKVMAAGKYIIKLISKDGSQNATIEFQKL